MIEERLLKVLACPICGASVELKTEKIICIKCEAKFPIKDDIPVMLAEEAER